MSKTYRYDARYESQRARPRWSGQLRHGTDHRRAAVGAETFRCRHCKLMVGPIPSGGRQRNHCPNCLHSRHVDGKTPGDRASDCGALMAPVGTFARPNGEQVLVHQCAGCGFQRYNRVAADDNWLALMRLPLLVPLSPAQQAPKRKQA